MRENAARKRDERILDLWRKDQSGPTVESLVNKMVTLKSKTVRHDWSDDNTSNLNVHDFDSIADNQDMQSIVSHDGDKTAAGPS